MVPLVQNNLSVSEIKDALEQAQHQELTDEDLLKSIILGWEGVADEDGDTMPFSDAALIQQEPF